MKSLIRKVIRIVTISSLGLMVIALPPAVFAQAQSSPADWTQFHRDNMERWNPHETVLGVGDVGSLHLKWTNSSPLDASAPAVVNGVVYVGSFGLSTMYALNANTGAKLWSYTTGNNVETSPAVANGVVYIGSDDGNTYALNASTGALLWSYPGGVSHYLGAIPASPAVANGVVYVGGVTALNASTGAKLWSYPVGTSSASSSPTVVDGVLYVGNFAFSLGSADLYLRIQPTPTCSPSQCCSPGWDQACPPWSPHFP